VNYPFKNPIGGWC